jgi:hypothetical protein
VAGQRNPTLAFGLIGTLVALSTTKHNRAERIRFISIGLQIPFPLPGGF